jgi:hypothetical protein
LVPALSLQLEWVEIQQLALNAKQKWVRLSNEQAARSEVYKLNQQSGFNSELPTIKMAVIAVNPSSLSPSYQSLQPLEEHQKIVVTWKTSLQDILPKSIARYFAKENILQGHCGMTLKEENQNWNIKMHADNVLSKVF